MSANDLDQKFEPTAEATERLRAEAENEPVEQGSAGGPRDINTPVAEVFGIETPSDVAKYQSKLNTVIDWAKTQTEDHTPENLKWVIREKLRRMNVPLTEKPINYFTRYAYLMSERAKIDEEVAKF